MTNPLGAYYAKALKKVEKETRTYSNNVKLGERLSSGILVYDWLCNGGIISGLSVVSGPEASGKTTNSYHSIANAIKMELPFNIFWDAEGTLNPKLADNIWKQFGVSYHTVRDAELLRYYRRNVIEVFFDFMVKQLNLMPDKVWQPDLNTWAYLIPKRDEHFKNLMGLLELKPDRKLSNDHEFVCPTEYGGPEGITILDSFAAMLTKDTEEEEKKSGRRAEEASAFSTNLRRVAAKLQDKHYILQATNQVRINPQSTHNKNPEAQLYEPGGEAIKFFSHTRARLFSRAVRDGFERDGDNGSVCVEQSVEGNGVDKYAFKEYKNTKNKFGVPLLKSYARVWIADRSGNGRGFDPVYDVQQHLLNTKQLIQKGKSMRFRLKDSVGKQRAEMLNECGEFNFQTLKKLVLAETTGRKDLLAEAAKELGITRNPALRTSLFNQMRADETLYQRHEDLKAKKEADTDYEEL